MSPETAFDGLPLADAPLSVTAFDGTVVVAVQTAVSEVVDAGPSEPDSVVLAHGPTGTWRTALFARVGDRLGQPVVLVDPEAGQVYGFATSPRRGGTVHLKRSSIDRLEFPSGRGLTVISNPSDPRIAYLGFGQGPGRPRRRLRRAGVRRSDRLLLGCAYRASRRDRTSPAPSASSSASPSATPGASRRTALFTDGFDAWQPGATIEQGWELGPAGVTGTLKAAADATGDGRHARLRPDAKDAVRACEAFRPRAQVVSSPTRRSASMPSAPPTP